jgi:cellulose biosynthesis protein BcsQ
MTTLALVGAVGGAGTTRTAVEMATVLAQDDRSVAVLDTAFATQGLATYVDGRITADITAVATDEAVFADSLYEPDYDVPGRVAFCPAHAPFERLARAKAQESARTIETLIDDAATQFDDVLVDVPPIAANQSVAALTTADRRALVVPATQHGADLLPRQQGRLRDLDAPADTIIGTRADESFPEADYELPTDDPNGPTALSLDSPIAPAVATAVEGLFDIDLDLEFDDGGFVDRIKS